MGIFRQFPYSNFHDMNMDEIIKIIKDMLEDWAQYYTTWDDWKETVTSEWSEMQTFINNYFTNLNVQTEINKKINAMVNSGEFSQIVDPFIPPEVSSWLAEHITTPETVVIDDSLTIEGACADAKATGDAIADCLQINPNIETVDFTSISGKYINTSNETVTDAAGFEYVDLYVVERDTLYLTGWASSSAYAPAFWSDDALIETVDVTTENNYFSNVEVIVPLGATRLLINGRPSLSQDIYIEKEVMRADSKQFLNEYYEKTEHKYGVSLASDGTCKVFCANYGDGEVLRVCLNRKAVNNLPDFDSFLVYTDGSQDLVPLTDVPVSDTTRLRFIVNGSTDFLSPCIVYAQNNADGDFPSMTNGKLTGGWHGYNSGTATGTPTASNVDYDVICDGVKLSPNHSTRCNNLEIHITNRIQASNTEKSDGTGREVVEFKYRLVFDDFKVKVYGSIRALEPIEIQLLYGISCRHVYNNVPIYYVGSRVNRGEYFDNVTSNSGDKHATGIEQIDTDIFHMGINPNIDLGSMYMNDRAYSVLIANGKSYMVLIDDNGYQQQRLVLDTDEMAFYEGYYSAYKE